jgi:aryl-alcohol dehydrogenase
MGQSSLATGAVASGSSVIRVPDDLPLELLGPLGCGVQTGAGTVMRALRIDAGSSVAVFGAGAVGLSAVAAASVSGATCIVAIDRVASRLELAKHFGATHVVLAEERDLAGAVRDASAGGVDYSIECAGSPAAFSAAVDALRHLGHCAVVGGVKPGTRASYDWRSAQAKGITIHAVVEGDAVPSEFMPVLMDLLRRGRFPLEAMVKFFDLDQIEEACQAAQSGEVIKPILRMPA